MKILIAADGKTLGSTVARRFAKASWYLVVDPESNDLEVFPNTKLEDYHDIFPRAVQRGVNTVVAGSVGSRSFELFSFHNLQIAFARNLTGQDAIQRLKQGTLKILHAPAALKNIEEHELLQRGRRGMPGKGKTSLRGKGAYATGTPRGQHHLQQYGGRGH